MVGQFDFHRLSLSAVTLRLHRRAGTGDAASSRGNRDRDGVRLHERRGSARLRHRFFYHYRVIALSDDSDINIT